MQRGRYRCRSAKAAKQRLHGLRRYQVGLCRLTRIYYVTGRWDTTIVTDDAAWTWVPAKGTGLFDEPGFGRGVSHFATCPKSGAV